MTTPIAELVKRLRAVLDRDVSYNANGISIEFGSHAEALRAMREARTALEALSAPPSEGEASKAGGSIDVVGRAIRPFLVQAFLLGWGQSAEGYNAEYGALKSDIADKAEQECCDIDMPAARAAIAALPRRDGMERMREALQLIANAIHPRFRTEDDIDQLYANEKAFGDCINIARAALGES